MINVIVQVGAVSLGVTEGAMDSLPIMNVHTINFESPLPDVVMNSLPTPVTTSQMLSAGVWESHTCAHTNMAHAHTSQDNTLTNTQLSWDQKDQWREDQSSKQHYISADVQTSSVHRSYTTSSRTCLTALPSPTPDLPCSPSTLTSPYTNLELIRDVRQRIWVILTNLPVPFLSAGINLADLIPWQQSCPRNNRHTEVGGRSEEEPGEVETRKTSERWSKIGGELRMVADQFQHRQSRVGNSNAGRLSVSPTLAASWGISLSLVCLLSWKYISKYQ
ncbi:uncharacterized protein [Cherax quadricarinatus]|uniref:uncharacterized protein n=1 Tax=Cherax quadricarinatus TaxID=27406 RepID=UPI00387E392B